MHKSRSRQDLCNFNSISGTLTTGLRKTIAAFALHAHRGLRINRPDFSRWIGKVEKIKTETTSVLFPIQTALTIQIPSQEDGSAFPFTPLIKTQFSQCFFASLFFLLAATQRIETHGHGNPVSSARNTTQLLSLSRSAYQIPGILLGSGS